MVSRLVFPHTIILGMQKNNLIFNTSLMATIINLTLSLIFIQWWGIIGVAFATVIAHYLNKLVLVVYVNKFHISPNDYMAMKIWLAGSLLIWCAFILNF